MATMGPTHIYHIVFQTLLLKTTMKCISSQTGPDNVVVQTGDTVMLPCHFPTATSQVSWYRDVTRLTVDKSITGDAFPWVHRVVGDDSVNEYNLRITNVNAGRDAEKYGCNFVISPIVYQYNAHLIVIDNPISCSIKVTPPGGSSSPPGSVVVAGDVIDVSCQIAYTGRWSPDIVCTSPFTAVVTNTTTATEASFAYQYIVTPTSGTKDISCTALFQDVDSKFPADDDPAFNPSVSHYFARNVPAYSSSWSASTFSVEYAPENITIAPVQPVYDPGDVITCTSSANPSASYEWRSVGDSLVTSGNTYTVSNAVTNGDQLTCVARNTHGDGRSDIVINIPTTTTTTTTPTTTPTTTTSMAQSAAGPGVSWWVYLLAAMAAMLLVIMIILLVKCCLRPNKVTHLTVGCGDKTVEHMAFSDPITATSKLSYGHFSNEHEQWLKYAREQAEGKYLRDVHTGFNSNYKANFTNDHETWLKYARNHTKGDYITDVT